MKRLSMRCKEEFIAHCKVGEMDICFSVVDNLATEIRVHDGSRDALVLKI